MKYLKYFSSDDGFSEASLNFIALQSRLGKAFISNNFVPVTTLFNKRFDIMTVQCFS